MSFRVGKSEPVGSALARICDEVEREWFAGETERDRRFEEEEQETRELIGLLVNDGDSWQRHNDEARQIESRMAGGS